MVSAVLRRAECGNFDEVCALVAERDEARGAEVRVGAVLGNVHAFLDFLSRRDDEVVLVAGSELNDLDKARVGHPAFHHENLAVDWFGRGEEGDSEAEKGYD